MKRFFYLVCLLIANQSVAAVPMARVIGIINSHTIAVDGSTIVLRGVDVPSAEEIAAMDYLHRQLDGTWVYVEDGNVYRSPDGLYVNAEMQRHAWRAAPGMRYLGESYPGPIKPPRRFARTGSPSRVRRRARLR